MAGWASRLVDAQGLVSSPLSRHRRVRSDGLNDESLSEPATLPEAVRRAVHNARSPNVQRRRRRRRESCGFSAEGVDYVAFSRRLIPNIPQTAPFRSLYVPLVAHSPLVAVEYRRRHSLRDKRGVSPSPTRRRVVVTALLACAAVAFAAPCATSAGSPTTGSNPAAPLWRAYPLEQTATTARGSAVPSTDPPHRTAAPDPPPGRGGADAATTP